MNSLTNKFFIALSTSVEFDAVIQKNKQICGLRMYGSQRVLSILSNWNDTMSQKRIRLGLVVSFILTMSSCQMECST